MKGGKKTKARGSHVLPSQYKELEPARGAEEVAIEGGALNGDKVTAIST